jgi:hypothetical protein
MQEKIAIIYIASLYNTLFEHTITKIYTLIAWGSNIYIVIIWIIYLSFTN